MGNTLKDHWALVTGASGGIGEALARRLAQEGASLILVARSTSKLDEIAADLGQKHGISTKVISADLGQADAPEAVFAETQRAGLAVDILVNSAGFATYGPFVDLDLVKEMEMVQVNVAALTHLTHLYLKGMVARRHGWILNIASTAAFQPGPLMAVYYATKAYVLFFSEAIASELEGTGVTVTALCPGPTWTGFQSRAKMQESRLLASGVMNVQDVAEEGYRALLAGRTSVIPGARNWWLAQAPRFMPRDAVARFVRRIQERTGR